MTEPRGWLHRVVWAAIFSVGGAACLLLLLEAGCRLSGWIRLGRWPVTRVEDHARLSRQVAAAYLPHPYLLSVGRPGATIRVLGHELHFNSLGLRGRELARTKSPGQRRIVCEGGSTTFDLRAPDDARAWPARLEANLLAMGVNVDVANCGFPGWTTIENLIALEVRDLDLGPDVVVVFTGINDLQPAGHVPFTPDYSLGHGDVQPRVVGVVQPAIPIYFRSLLIESLLDLLHGPDGSIDPYAPAWHWPKGDRQERIPEAAVATYERNLRSIIALTASRNARTLLVAQVVRFRQGRESGDGEYVISWSPGLTPSGFAAGLAQFNGVARRLANEHLADFLDPFAKEQFLDSEFSDPFHFSESGSRHFARILAAYLAAHMRP